jgi:hypothetical protein
MKRRFEPLADLNLEPIPTPVSLKLLRARYKFMPATIFVVALGLSVFLWKNYGGNTQGTGEVSATTIQIAAVKDGVLVESSTFPRLYDHVEKGQTLARLEGKQSINLVAPVTGMVTSIRHQPGEFINQGQEVMSVTADGGAYIVSYIRPGSSIVPKKNMKVAVRGQDHHKWAECRIQEVGTRVVPIPEHQLANAKTPEWGIPVRIEMPQAGELLLRPGELVMLNFKGEEAK